MKTGWYYDRQLEDPRLSVSLHPNQVVDPNELKNNKEVVWKNPSEVGYEEDNEKCVNPTDDKPTGPGYSKTPIARSILMDDFNVSVANNWSPYGGDFLSSAWEQFRTAAPYAPALTAGLDKLSERLKQDAETSSRPEWLNTIESVIGFMASTTSNQLNLFGDRLNYSLVSQGTRFSYYAGSGVAFGGLGMRYTVFPKFDQQGRFISVIDQVQELLYYVNGRLETETYGTVSKSIEDYIDKQKDANSDLRATLNEYKKYAEVWKKRTPETIKDLKEKLSNSWNNLKEKLEPIADKAKGTIVTIADDVIHALLDAELLAWQKPPGGFKPYYKDIDRAIQGTLKLRVGDKYSVSSLVCQDASFNFSKLSVKVPGVGKYTPLYCDVNITLAPATKFSNISLEKFISGMYNSEKQRLQNLEKDKFSYKEPLYYVS